MKKYFSIIKNQVAVQLAYKFDFMAGLISKSIQLAMAYFMWQGVFHSTEWLQIGDYSQNELLSYIVLSNVISLLFTFEHAFRLGVLVRSGKLTTMLLRPISFLKESFANFVGSKLVLIVICFLFCQIGVIRGRFFVNSCLVAIFVISNFAMFFLLLSVVSTASFWLVQTWMLRPVLSALYLLLGGLYFPLDLLPGKLSQVLQYTPFALVGHVTTKLFQGMYTDADMLIFILVTWIWAIVFWNLYNFLWQRGLKRYEGMGS